MKVPKLSPRGGRILDAAVERGRLLAHGHLGATIEMAEVIDEALRPSLSLSQIDRLLKKSSQWHPADEDIAKTLLALRAELSKEGADAGS